jgi:hypothetical protein
MNEPAQDARNRRREAGDFPAPRNCLIVDHAGSVAAARAKSYAVGRQVIDSHQDVFRCVVTQRIRL